MPRPIKRTNRLQMLSLSYGICNTVEKTFREKKIKSHGGYKVELIDRKSMRNLAEKNSYFEVSNCKEKYRPT